MIELEVRYNYDGENKKNYSRKIVEVTEEEFRDYLFSAMLTTYMYSSQNLREDEDDHFPDCFYAAMDPRVPTINRDNFIAKVLKKANLDYAPWDYDEEFDIVFHVEFDDDEDFKESGYITEVCLFGQF